jgi:hypothetical protein
MFQKMCYIEDMEYYSTMKNKILSSQWNDGTGGNNAKLNKSDTEWQILHLLSHKLRKLIWI